VENLRGTAISVHVGPSMPRYLSNATYCAFTALSETPSCRHHGLQLQTLYQIVFASPQLSRTHMCTSESVSIMFLLCPTLHLRRILAAKCKKTSITSMNIASRAGLHRLGLLDRIEFTTNILYNTGPDRPYIVYVSIHHHAFVL
jgi:hypothetical protein